ncbi:hypothetical protein Hanom_Chr00s003938g01716771 [Helianthus anomalus]
MGLVPEKKFNKPKKSARPSTFIPPTGHIFEHPGNGNEDVCSDVLECSRTLEPHLSFKEVKSFEDILGSFSKLLA